MNVAAVLDPTLTVDNEEDSGKVWGVESRSGIGGGGDKPGGVTSYTVGGGGVVNGVVEDKVSDGHWRDW